MSIITLNGYVRDNQGLIHEQTLVYDPEDDTYTTRLGLEWVGRDLDASGDPKITQLAGWAFCDAYSIRFASGLIHFVAADHRGQKQAATA